MDFDDSGVVIIYELIASGADGARVASDERHRWMNTKSYCLILLWYFLFVLDQIFLYNIS